MDRCAVAVFAAIQFLSLAVACFLVVSRGTIRYLSNLKQYRLLNLTPTATTNKET